MSSGSALPDGEDCEKTSRSIWVIAEYKLPTVRSEHAHQPHSPARSTRRSTHAKYRTDSGPCSLALSSVSRAAGELAGLVWGFPSKPGVSPGVARHTFACASTLARVCAMRRHEPADVSAYADTHDNAYAH
jgi:hypothetical protein